jgi:predicted alpha/beta hydrolase family esterase
LQYQTIYAVKDTLVEKVLILHGWGGSHDPHWQYWLSQELKNHQIDVLFPTLPNEDYPNLLEWKEAVLNYLDTFKPSKVILHSLANTLWLHLIGDKRFKEVSTLLMVAPPALELDIFELQCFNLKTPPNFYGAKEGLMVLSSNDPYMQLSEGEMLAQQLGIKTLILQDAGHINSDSGFGAWPFPLHWVQGKE